AHKILLQTEKECKESKNLTVCLHFSKSTDWHCYNFLLTNEIAVILPGDKLISKVTCDIILRLHGDPLQQIHEGHPTYLPFHYVLLFSYSELKWSTELHHTITDAE
ncbi:15307_t:CDS:1, partial [Acaulospora morrowiae]